MHRLMPLLAQHDHVIWDWNGTLLDDVDICVEAISELLVDHGLDPIDRDGYRNQFGFPVRNYYAGLGLPLENGAFEELSKRFIDLYNIKAEQVGLHSGVKQLVENLRLTGIGSSVLSAARQGDLTTQLIKHGIYDFMEEVYGLDNIHAQSKVGRGLELKERLASRYSSLLLVGDTDHDLEVGTAMNIDVLLLAHGHQHHDRLYAVHDRVIISMEEI